MIRMYQFLPTFHYQTYRFVSCEVKYENDMYEIFFWLDHV